MRSHVIVCSGQGVRFALVGMALSMAACSSCGKKPPPAAPDAGIVALDGGLTLAPDAGFHPPPIGNLSPAAQAAKESKHLPYGYPLTPDAPDWTWPATRIEAGHGKKTVYVVGWAKSVSNPGMARALAEANARTNMLRTLQDGNIDTSGLAMGGLAGVTFDKTFQSSTGAVFVEGVLQVSSN